MHDRRRICKLPERGRDPLAWSDPLRVLVRALREFPAPIFASIEGTVLGGGCKVALACDKRMLARLAGDVRGRQ